MGFSSFSERFTGLCINNWLKSKKACTVFLFAPEKPLKVKIFKNPFFYYAEGVMFLFLGLVHFYSF